MPCVTAAGSKLDNISFDECLDRLVQVMDYDRLRQEQAALRQAGIYAASASPPSSSPRLTDRSSTVRPVRDLGARRLHHPPRAERIVKVRDQHHRPGARHDPFVGANHRRHSGRRYRGRRDDRRRQRDLHLRGRRLGVARHRHRRRGGAQSGALLARNILSVAAAIAQTSPDDLQIVRGQIANKHPPAPVITSPRSPRSATSAGHAAAGSRRAIHGHPQPRRQ